MNNLNILKGATNAGQYMQVFGANFAVFLREGLAYFCKIVINHILLIIVKESKVLNWPDYNPTNLF